MDNQSTNPMPLQLDVEAAQLNFRNELEDLSILMGQGAEKLILIKIRPITIGETSLRYEQNYLLQESYQKLFERWLKAGKDHAPFTTAAYNSGLIINLQGLVLLERKVKMILVEHEDGPEFVLDGSDGEQLELVLPSIARYISEATQQLIPTNTGSGYSIEISTKKETKQLGILTHEELGNARSELKIIQTLKSHPAFEGNISTVFKHSYSREMKQEIRSSPIQQIDEDSLGYVMHSEKFVLDIQLPVVTEESVEPNQDRTTLSEMLEHKLRTAYRQLDIPRPMKVGKTRRVNLSVAKQIEQLQKTTDTIDIKEIKIVNQVKANLKGDKFNIVAVNDDLQKFVGDDAPSEWSWDVTPKESGIHKLELVMSTVITIPGEGNVQKEFPLSKEDVEVLVNIPYTVTKWTKNNWQYIAGFLFGTGMLWKAIDYFMGKK